MASGAEQTISGLGKAGFLVYFIWKGVEEKKILEQAKLFLQQISLNHPAFEEKIVGLVDRLYLDII